MAPLHIIKHVFIFILIGKNIGQEINNDRGMNMYKMNSYTREEQVRLHMYRNWFPEDYTVAGQNDLIYGYDEYNKLYFRLSGTPHICRTKNKYKRDTFKYMTFAEKLLFQQKQMNSNVLNKKGQYYDFLICPHPNTTSNATICCGHDASNQDCCIPPKDYSQYILLSIMGTFLFCICFVLPLTIICLSCKITSFNDNDPYETRNPNDLPLSPFMQMDFPNWQDPMGEYNSPVVIQPNPPSYTQESPPAYTVEYSQPDGIIQIPASQATPTLPQPEPGNDFLDILPPFHLNHTHLASAHGRRSSRRTPHVNTRNAPVLTRAQRRQERHNRRANRRTDTTATTPATTTTTPRTPTTVAILVTNTSPQPAINTFSAQSLNTSGNSTETNNDYVAPDPRTMATNQTNNVTNENNSAVANHVSVNNESPRENESRNRDKSAGGFTLPLD